MIERVSGCCRYLAVRSHFPFRNRKDHAPKSSVANLIRAQAVLENTALHRVCHTSAIDLCYSTPRLYALFLCFKTSSLRVDGIIGYKGFPVLLATGSLPAASTDLSGLSETLENGVPGNL